MASTDEPSNEQEPLHNNREHWRRPHVLLVAFAVALVVFVVGAAIGHVSDRFGMMRAGVDGRFGVRSQMFTGGVQYSNQLQIEGVVSNVNGSTLTVAGNGATNSVVTNGSTQYTGSSQPKVNDTVVATGSLSNGTFTATQITINP